MTRDRAKELEETLKTLRALIDSPTPIERQAVETPRVQDKKPPVLTKVVQYSLSNAPEWETPQERKKPAVEGIDDGPASLDELADELASIALKTMASNINQPASVASRMLKKTLLDALRQSTPAMRKILLTPTPRLPAAKGKTPKK